MLLCGRIRVAMLLVLQVALPKVPCFALWSCFPMEPCGFPAGSYSPMVPCFALWSCFPMVLCAVPGGSCFSMMHCGRMRVAMLLVRHVARPDGALLCAVELLPDGALRRPWR